MVPISSPVAKSLLALPDPLGKTWLRVLAARSASLTVAPVTVSVLVAGSTDLLPVEKSMVARGARGRVVPLGRVGTDLTKFRSKATLSSVLRSWVPTGGG